MDITHRHEYSNINTDNISQTKNRNDEIMVYARQNIELFCLEYRQRIMNCLVDLSKYFCAHAQTFSISAFDIIRIHVIFLRPVPKCRSEIHQTVCPTINIYRTQLKWSFYSLFIRFVIPKSTILNLLAGSSTTWLFKAKPLTQLNINTKKMTEKRETDLSLIWCENYQPR